MKHSIYLIIPIFLLPFCLGGCVTKAGLQTRYYVDCNEYYDAMGGYHKECPESLGIKDVTGLFKSKPKPKEPDFQECLGCQ